MNDSDLKLIRTTCRNVNVVCTLVVLWLLAKGAWVMLTAMAAASRY